MNSRKLSIAVMLLIVALSFASESRSQTTLAERAKQEFLDGKFSAAENDLRELTKKGEGNIFAWEYLGHSLFRQDKYAEAIAPYEKARALERSGEKLSDGEHHVLIDQLVMAYGISGQLKKSRALLD